MIFHDRLKVLLELIVGGEYEREGWLRHLWYLLCSEHEGLQNVNKLAEPFPVLACKAEIRVLVSLEGPFIDSLPSLSIHLSCGGVCQTHLSQHESTSYHLISVVPPCSNILDNHEVRQGLGHRIQSIEDLADPVEVLAVLG